MALYFIKYLVIGNIGNCEVFRTTYFKFAELFYFGFGSLEAQN
jgi:hypothetical protein